MNALAYDGTITIDGHDLADSITGFSQTIDDREGWHLTFQGPDSDALARFFPDANSVYAHVEVGGRTLTGPLTVYSRIEHLGMVHVEMFGAPPLQV
jgi:hypothetical protein